MKLGSAASRFPLLLLLAALLPACGLKGTGTLTPTVAPLRPDLVVASGGPSRITLTWSVSPAAAKYQVKRATAAGGPYATLPQGAAVASTLFVDSGVTNGTRYYYVVSASNSFGTSADSQEASAVPGLTFTSAAGALAHSLGLEADGTVWAWGSNAYGVLGNGQTSISLVPMIIPGLSEVKAVSAAMHNSMALTQDGRVWTWGSNDSGQLGNGTSGVGTYSRDPTPVPGLPPVTAISMGTFHVLALCSDGSVWAWGNMTYGQVGIGIGGNQMSPIQVPGVANIVSIAAGSTYSLALRNDGLVLAWGRNTGTLGDGTKTDRGSAAPVTNLTDVTAIAAGDAHGLALRSDSTVFSWGQNNHGQLGLNSPSTLESLVPVKVPGLSGIRSVAAGATTSHALQQGGDLFCWGEGTYGALGLGDTADAQAPARLTSLSNLTEIQGAAQHTMALQATGQMWCWGSNAQGELGNGTTSAGLIPQDVYNLNGVTFLGAGLAASYALRTDVTGTTCWAWGEDPQGKFGGGTGGVSKSTIPFHVAALDSYIAVTGGNNHAVGLRNDNVVLAWGDNTWTQLGAAGPASPTPVAVPGLNQTSAIAAKFDHSLALRNGAVWSWGSWGAVAGLPSGLYQVSTLSNITAISTGVYHGIALQSNGTVWTWGANVWGQIGNGTTGTTAVYPPVNLTGLSGVKAIAAGNLHNLALLTDGTVWGWGSNNSGELGLDPVVSSVTSPVQIPGLTGVTAITAGNAFSAALKSDGSVWVWGNNLDGLLGNGTTISSEIPASVAGIPAITSLTCSGEHILVRASNTTAWAWGWNGYGQLGISTNPKGSSVPIPVLQ